MARTIGKRNIALVKRTTRKVWEKQGASRVSEVIALLPVTLWDIWEMSDQEIRNIIRDELMELAHEGGD